MRSWLRENFYTSFPAYVLLALILGSVYVATLLPGVGYSGDTAKFQFVGKVLGTPHATGYPTYLVLNHFFVTLFPFGNLAAKANLLSAIFSVGASLVLLRILQTVAVSGLVALVTALAFGFTQTLWLQSLVAEVYTLNVLFVSLVILFFLRWSQTRRDLDFLLGCAVYAFSFGNHLTMITFLPAIVVLVWTTDRRVFVDRKKLLWVALFILLAAAQYLYIFWRVGDLTTPYLEMRPGTWQEFLWYMTGARFSVRIGAFTLEELLIQRIPMFLDLVWKQFYLLLPLALIGMVRFKDRRANTFLLLALLGNILYALNYDIYDIFVYFIPGYLILAIYLGKGIEALAEVWPHRLRWLGAVLLVAMPLALFAVNVGAVNQRGQTADARRVEQIIQQLGDNAVIVPPDYHYAEYFWYYLLGAEAGQHSLYVLNKFSGESVRAYLDGSGSFDLPNPRRGQAPLGLPVYGLDAGQRRLLEQSGLATQDVAGGMYVVTVR